MEDGKKNLFAALSYVWVFCLIPVLSKDKDEFTKFHARQGLMLFIIEIAIAVVSVLPLFGGLINVLGVIVCGLLSIIGIVQVLVGNKWEMPIVGSLAEKIKI